jgi:hypothetical protein
LLARGLTPRRAALLLYAVCGIGATLSLLQSVADNHFAGVIIVLFCAAAWIGIQHLGYPEFKIAARVANFGTFRDVMSTQLRVRSVEEAIQQAGSIEECWNAVRSAARDLGFTRVHLRLDRGTFHAGANGSSHAALWTMRVPLSRDEYLEFSHDNPGANSVAAVAAPLADVVRRTMVLKMAELQLAYFHADERMCRN